MSYSPITDTLNVHQSRATEPTESDTVLKALFDQDVNTVKTRVNEIVTELNSATDGDSGADNLGMTPITGITATSVQGTLEELNTRSSGSVSAISALQSADVTLQSNIDSEASTRSAKDISLQAEVDGLTTANTQNVKLTGNQTIAGVKTFSSSPIVPTPTADTQTASKGYVDTTLSDAILGAVPDGSITDAKLANTTGAVKQDVAGLISGSISAAVAVSANTLDGRDSSTDGTLAANSDSLIPTQKAVKTYVDTYGSCCATGSYAGSGTNLRAITVGFEPKIVKLYTATVDRSIITITDEVSAIMDYGSAKLVVPSYWDTDPALSSTGFVTASMTSLFDKYSGNASGTTYYWEAFR